MEHARHTQARSLVDAVSAILPAQSRLGCVIDPSRHGGAEEAARSLGIEAEAFQQLVNFYDGFATAHRAEGPRWVLPVDEAQLQRLAEMAVARQGVHFVVTCGSMPEVLAHLRSLVKLPQPDGSQLLFRWQDSFVLNALLPVLSVAQKDALLGPVQTWLTLDACRNEVRLERTSTKPISTALRLDTGQLERLSRAMLPFTVFRQIDEVDSSLLAGLDECARLGRINPLLERAQEQGLESDEDQSLYVALALQLPPGFDRSGPVARALERARTGSVGFGEAIDQVPIEEWRAWDVELDAGGDVDG